MNAEEQPWVDTPPKYEPYESGALELSLPWLYVHGLFFSLIGIGVSFLWGFMVIVLAVLGGFIGLILSFPLLALMIGSVNLRLVDTIWRIKCQSHWVSVLIQGGLLFLFLLIMGFALIPLTGFGIVFSVFLDFVVLPIFYGYVFRSVALQFEDSMTKSEIGRVPSNHKSWKCPFCQRSYAYRITSRAEDGTVACLNCTRRFLLPV
ncbi:MAG: hypothetical protein KGD60_03080 [Candidatus Thorarchaeota archaeon]|nr:hypothetical protein [Candidatus Thorarchaeota archaeon]